MARAAASSLQPHMGHSIAEGTARTARMKFIDLSPYDESTITLDNKGPSGRRQDGGEALLEKLMDIDFF
jgi:hypothetical protein